MPLLHTLHQSKDIICCAVTKKGKEFYKFVPIYSEIIDLFINVVHKSGDQPLETLPDLPNRLSDVQQGIYKKNDELILFYDIPKGFLKYIAMFSSKHFGASAIAKELSGFYIATLKKCSDDPLVYSPQPFVYFYTPVSDKEETYSKKVVPMLALECDIKPDFFNYWVYLAVRKLSKDYFPDIQYEYLLAEESKESLIFLKECGFLDGF